METESKKYPGACLDCGGEVTVPPDADEEPQGLCVNFGQVAWDVSLKDGEPSDGFSKGAWLSRNR